MLKNLTRWMGISALLAMLALPSVMCAQALPTATSMASLQVGAGYADAAPDYTKSSIHGISAFVDYDFRQHIGVELAIHDVTLDTPSGVGESSYLIGPRFLLPRGPFTLYGKVSAGMGSLSGQAVQKSSYSAYAFGGGLDYRVTRHIVVRAFDYEAQHWSTGLTPTVITIGAAYRF